VPGIRRRCQTGWRTCRGTPALFEELVDRGYTDEDLGKIAGGNVLRVMREGKPLRERR
jgi:membrane dipeptidase